jgi:hypothetical protein
MFTKLLDDGILSIGETVYAPNFTLTSKEKDQIKDGWRWFNSEKEARAAFGLKEKYDNEELNRIQDQIDELEKEKKRIMKEIK